tara:strand:- start:17 stop:862 length:846 start_codon:yes stop_codon:yes gene_type:complete
MHPQPDELQRIIVGALTEDIGQGDITSAAIIGNDATASMRFVAREKLVVAGASLMGMVFTSLLDGMQYTPQAEEGAQLEAGAVLATLSGNAQAILAGERVALNLLQRMCGIATLTRAYVDAVAGTDTTILDTRKTAPGLRALDKYAVLCGGGANHRMRLDDGVMIKDNHIAVAGSIAQAVAQARQATPMLTRIEVECDTLAQVEEALNTEVDVILLDNMSLDDMRQAVSMAKGACKMEASGNVTLERVRAIAETGVDYISIGRLTHSVKAADIGLDMESAA